MSVSARTFFKEGHWGEQTDQHGTYTSEINTKNPNNVTVKVKDENNNKLRVQSVIWRGVDRLGTNSLLALVKNSKERFDVKIEPVLKGSLDVKVFIELRDIKQIELRDIKQNVAASEEDEKIFHRLKEANQLTLMNCKNAGDFAQICQNEDPNLVKAILAKMVDAFLKNPSNENSIHEIFAIMGYLSQDDLLKIIECLAQQICSNIVHRISMLAGLTDILTQINRENLRRVFKVMDEDPKADFNTVLKEKMVFPVEGNGLVSLMDKIMETLDKEHNDSTTVAIFLNTLMAITEIMLVLEVQGLDKERHHDKFVRVLERFKTKDPKAEFLLKYSLQHFIIIKNNESNSHAFFRRAYHLFKGLAKIGSNISLVEPWKILDVIDSTSEFKQAFEGDRKPRDWFIKLKVLRELFLRNDSEYLISFAGQVKLNPVEARKSLPKKSRYLGYFIQGLVILLKEVLDTKGRHDLKVKQAVLSLLKEIKEAQSQKSPLFFIEKKEISNAIVQEIDEPTSKYNSPRAVNAREVLQAFPEVRFIDALNASASWMQRIKKMAEGLDEDQQVLEEWEYVIAVKGKDSDAETKEKS